MPRASITDRDTLTAVELVELEAWAADMTDRDAAASRYVSRETVRQHRQTIRRKLNRSTGAGVVAEAFRLGLLR